ncbi:hypothetical protein ACS0TY_018214 [Phlomoides rotata]
MASLDLIHELFGEDSDDEVNTQDNGTQINSDSVPTEDNEGNGTQNNLSSVPTYNNVEEDLSVIEPAHLNVKKLDDETWIVTKMVNEHNHEIDPTFSPLMAAHRHLDIHIHRQLEADGIAGIRPCKNVRLLKVQSSGPKNLGCLPKDCRNFIEERRRLRLGDGDAEAIRKMFATL